jgi:hypothetical protein
MLQGERPAGLFMVENGTAIRAIGAPTLEPDLTSR